MSATTTWKCPQCGMDWAVSYRKCPADGYVNMPACVSLVSAKTGRGADLSATAKLGKSVFKQRFADDDAQFAADEQFEIVRDTDLGAWVLRPVAGVKNATYYNGTEVPPGGCELSEGGVITVGKSRMRMTVTMK
ncbi:MAG: FHA domain-containing protein [Planctomycetes bacterium]|nr:FHA domain-containing protein [Planctomycetota bacterium]